MSDHGAWLVHPQTGAVTRCERRETIAVPVFDESGRYTVVSMASAWWRAKDSEGRAHDLLVFAATAEERERVARRLLDRATRGLPLDPPRCGHTDCAESAELAAACARSRR